MAGRNGRSGVESDATFLHENFSYVIPDCEDPNDPQCPINLGIFDSGATTFAFTGSRPDLEQSAYVQDAIRLGNWTVNAGLRWDHYQLLVNQNAVSPRVSVARYFPSAGLNVHASYDRIFQTPSFENILSVQFSGCGVSRHQRCRGAVAGRAFSRELLRIGSHESVLRESCGWTRICSAGT